jgi:hypothetical protein
MFSLFIRNEQFLPFPPGDELVITPIFIALLLKKNSENHGSMDFAFYSRVFSVLASRKAGTWFNILIAVYHSSTGFYGFQ